MIPHFSNFSDLTVITNGLRNALLLAENPDLRVIIACGTVRPNSGSLYGADTLNYLSGLNPGYCFISCGGLSGSGITESTFEQGAIKRQMLHGAEKRVLLCDSSKFEKKCLYRIGGLDEVDILVSDQLPSPQLTACLAQAGVRVIVPQNKKPGE